MPYIKTPSGINWFYQTKGKGENLVFLHGWSFDSGVWLKQINNFNNYKVLTLDLPGHGNSSYKDDIDITEELNFIFKKLKLSNINLVGHSLGGFLALKFTYTYPELIRRLILVGTPAKFVQSNGYEYGLRKSDINNIRGFLRKDYPNILSVFIRWLFTESERNQNNFREIWDSLTKRLIWPNKDILEKFLSIIANDDLRKESEDIKTPALLISGSDDQICPVDSINYLSKRIKNSKVEIFESCGHLPFLTQPEKFNRLVKDFLG